ncbi:MAG: 16S rRNA (guanine(527)-N(7))-methyltransferase RsmG [Phycisphaerales bacterium]
MSEKQGPDEPVRRVREAIEAVPAPAGFAAEASALGVELEPGDLERLHGYLRRLFVANATMNLTAIRDPIEAWSRHVLDALTLVGPIASASSAGERLRVLDLGSGGGVPGLVLASVMPEVEFTLVEATGKKARFLVDTAASLGLANVEVLSERAETLGHDPWLRGSRDVVVARAVGPLRVLVELAVPLLRVGGTLLAVKGERAPVEIAEAKRALHMLHAVAIDSISTPTGTIVVVEKSRETPKAYPRALGTPSHQPL